MINENTIVEKGRRKVQQFHAYNFKQKASKDLALTFLRLLFTMGEMPAKALLYSLLRHEPRKIEYSHNT